MPTKQFYSNKVTPILMLGVSLILITGIIFLLLDGSDQRTTAQNITIVLVAVFFLCCATIFAYRLYKPSLQLELSDTHLTYKSGKSYTSIAWNEIESFKFVLISNQKIIAITPTNLEKWKPGSGNSFSKAMNEWNEKTIGTHLTFSPGSIGVGSEKVMKLFKEYHENQPQ